MAQAEERHSDLLTGAALAVFRLNGQLLSIAEELARTSGLTAARWQVLGAAAEAPLPVSAVARRLGTSRQSVQRIADLLVERGLAEYRTNPAHRRAKLLAATEEGLAALRRIDPDRERVAKALVRELGEEDTEDAVESLRRLSRALDRIGDG